MPLYAAPPQKNVSEFVRVFQLLIALLFFSLFAPTANAQSTEVVQVGSGTLDYDSTNGQRWERVNIDPLFSGTHTIRVTWDGNADIRFSIFQILDAPKPNDRLLIATTSNTTTPGEWTGTLDDTEEYFLGIWSASGSGDYTATIEARELPVTVLSIAQGTLDSDKNLGPRWVRIDFDALVSGTHTISVSWDSEAEVRFNLFKTDSTSISTTVKGTNPGVWRGELDASEQYYMALWSADGAANYNATIEATVPISIARQPSDSIVTEGDDAHFFVDVTGSGILTYQWFTNGSPLFGETSDSLTVFATLLAEDGTTLTVEVSNGFETIVSDIATLTVKEPVSLGLFSENADTSAWMLEGPAPTLDYQVGTDTDAWGQALLRLGDVLLVGGDFQGIKPTRNATPTYRAYLSAFDAVTGQPVSTFQVPSSVDSTVRTLAASPDGNEVYVGGDFGLLILDAATGALQHSISVLNGNDPGRVFDIAVADSELYIGGDFSKVEGTSRLNIARLSLDGELDTSWNPKATHGYSRGRAAPVQSLAVSPSGHILYVGGNFQFINDTAVPESPLYGKRISFLSLSTFDGTVLPERFSPDFNSTSRRYISVVFDIAVTDNYVIIAWGVNNYLSFYSLNGDLLVQYPGTGDTQSLQIVGDHVFVGHHGEFFYTQDFYLNPEDGDIPYKLYSFRIDDPTFPPEQAWELRGTFGVWGIAAAEDSIWVTGQLTRAGSNNRSVEGLVRFPALD